ncbi:hypothetical protein E4U10_005263 [Claviceps purpurea]|nr:hypothetical protein E4U10_005263 [Claviceps purpurea]
MAPARPSSPDGGSSSTWRRRHNDDNYRSSLPGPLSPVTGAEEQRAHHASQHVPTRHSFEAAGGIARSSYPRSSIRRSLALETTRALGHDNHVLFPIQSRDPATEMETCSGGAADSSTQRASSQADIFTRPAHAASNSPFTPPVHGDKATKQLRRNKGRAGKGVSRHASWRQDLKSRLAAVYQQIIIEGLLRRKPLPQSRNGRHIPLDLSQDDGSTDLVDERSKKPYVSNFIRSSRYTVYDFVPKQLLFQFSKLGNFYFLVMGILQVTPGLSTVGRWTTIVPLSIFVAFSMAKEGFDDYRRYQLDKAENREKKERHLQRVPPDL